VSFEVTILGSGAAIPTTRRNPTSHYVLCNDRHLLIDCGESTQSQLRRFGIRLQRISHIFISHLHGDHFFGLAGLLSTMHLMGRDKGITIYGPPQLEEIIRMQLEVGGNKTRFDLTFVATNSKEPTLLYSDKMIEISSFPLRHRIPTTGFLIREKEKDRHLNTEALKGSRLKIEHYATLKKGIDIVLETGELCRAVDYTCAPHPPRAYAFCSDTVFYPEVVYSIKGVDVLYHEATFTNKEVERAKATYHSTAIQAAEIAKLAKVKKLLIGHLSARYDDPDTHLEEAKSVFLNTVVVEDGMKFSIG
jgi:ribonuclease Z